MTETLALSDAALRIAGILLLSVVAIESGGAFMLAIVRGKVASTDFQNSFARAGHAHVYGGAAVLAAGVVSLAVGLLTA